MADRFAKDLEALRARSLDRNLAKSPARKALATNRRRSILPLRCEAKDFSFQQFAIRLWPNVPRDCASS